MPIPHAAPTAAARLLHRQQPVRRATAPDHRRSARPSLTRGELYSSKQSSMGVVGACISGQLRTFFAPCVGARMRDNVLLPLSARTAISMSEPGDVEYRKNRSEQIRQLLAGVQLIGLRLEEGNATRTNGNGTIVMGGGLGGERPPCPTRGGGYSYTHHLLWCMDQFQKDAEDHGVRHTWVLRLRSDHNVHTRLASLPDRLPYDPDGRRGVAITGALGECECGFKKRLCKGEPLCLWTDDQFALLHGKAVDIYLREFRQAWCDADLLQGPQFLPHLRSKRWTSLDHLDSEARLAHLLSSRGVIVRDVRFVSQVAHAPLQRSSTCSPRDAVVNVPKESWEQLPPGPWDQRRVSVCKASRALEPRQRTLCLPHHNDSQWDDLKRTSSVYAICGRNLALCTPLDNSTDTLARRL